MIYPLLAATSAFTAGGPSLATLRAGRVVAPASMVLQEPPSFVSEGAAQQVGNNAFLNKDLMGRAIKGTGVKSNSKLKIGIVGAGLAGLVAAMDLADAGHEVEIFELRPFVGGKVSSWLDKEGNHIEMGLHVFLAATTTFSAS